ncbi:MAG: ATP-binding protein [Planctomycetota bacterium]
MAYPVSRLDADVIRRVQERCGRAELTAIDFLAGFGLADQVNGEDRCAAEAVLLFGVQFRSAVHPRAGIRVYQVEGMEQPEEGGPEEELKRRFDAPFIDMLEGVFSFMPTVIRRSSRLYSLFSREVPEYPTGAWQEFIINAVAHRDYMVKGCEIEIWIFDDRIEIFSPGRMYEGITVESLGKPRRHAHSSRNPKIADVLRTCGLMTETGRGIPTALKIMAKSYLNPPQFTELETGFLVTMQNSPVFEVGDREWEEKVRKLDLNLNQKRILIINKGFGFSNADYQMINTCDRDTAYREIHEIVQKGHLRCEGKSRGLKYYPVLE